MDSSTTTDSTVIGSAAEIAARLERATRSGLVSSSLASYSYFQASSTRAHPQPPTLEDLLPTLGRPDAVRCPACSAALPFGSGSRICLACTAPLQQFTPPSFTSSLAFRRFSEALHLDDLETNFGEPEEDLSLDPDVDIAIKSSSSLCLPLEVGGQKVLSSADVSSDEGKSSLHPEPVKSDVQTPVSSTSEPGSKTSAKPMGFANADGEKRPSILDYSTKLQGISLEDFFSNEAKAQAPATANSDMISDSFFGGATLGQTSGIKVRKDSLFWDPLSESIIPDGFDLMANTPETSTTKVGSTDKVFGVEDNDDPFSSWEGDFQSAAPAMPDVSNPSSSHIPGSQLSAQPITSTKIEDLFGEFPNVSSTAIQGKNSWVSNGDLFDLDLDVEKTFKVDSEKISTDVGNSFESGWQQSMPRPASSAANDSQSLSLSHNQSVSIKSSGKDLFGMGDMDTPTVDNSLDPGGECTSTGLVSGQSASASAGNKKKVVESLLAQLHDLSFLLADKLVIRTEVKNTKPDSSS